MDYTGGSEKRFNGHERPVFGPEIFTDQPERAPEKSPEEESTPEVQNDDSTVELSMPPGVEAMSAEEQAVEETEEIEEKEHKSAKVWALEVKEDIERDGDNPRKLQEDWVKNANKFLSDNYSRHWGDRN